MFVRTHNVLVNHRRRWHHVSYTDSATYGTSGNAHSYLEAIDLATEHAAKLQILKYLANRGNIQTASSQPGQTRP